MLEFYPFISKTLVLHQPSEGFLMILSPQFLHQHDMCLLRRAEPLPWRDAICEVGRGPELNAVGVLRVGSCSNKIRGVTRSRWVRELVKRMELSH